MRPIFPLSQVCKVHFYYIHIAMDESMGDMRGSRNFRQGGPGQSDKNSSDNVFFFFWSSAYSKEVKWSISKKSIIFQGSRGGPTFSKGGGGGGSNCLFPIETHITCDFPGGVRTPCPPLWIRTWVRHFLVNITARFCPLYFFNIF